nr:type VI secretion protein IcmF/TssM N-terminal domain-containing protein [Acidobacteriota bacterium]
MTDNPESKRHKVSFEAFDFDVKLRLQLRGELEVAVVHAEIRQETDSWALKIPETDAEYAGFSAVRPYLRGLIADVISNSRWNHSLDCDYCKRDLDLERVTASRMFEAIDDVLDAVGGGQSRETSDGYLSETAEETPGGGSSSLLEEAEIFFYILILRANEPYPDFLNKKRQRVQQLLQYLPHKLDEETLAGGLTPKTLEEVWSKSQMNLELSNDPETIPMGPVGDKWHAVEAFEKQNHLEEYDAPWYLLIGSAQSGKTTLLSSPDMAFHCVTADGQEQGPSYVVNAWYRSDSKEEADSGPMPVPRKAMILDIPSRYIGSEATSSDKAQWQHLLDLLRTHRPKAPINGVILTVSADDLLMFEEQRDRIARRLNRALQQVYQVLSCRFPVYILITKADHIYGLQPFAASLTTEQTKAPLGWSNPGGLTGYNAEDFQAGFEEMLDRVRAFRPYQLPKVATPYENLPPDLGLISRLQEDTLAAHGLPRELAALQDPLDDFLKRLFVQYGTEPVALFRGFYLISTRQEGKALVRAYNTHQPFEQVPLRPDPKNPADTDGQEQLFIRDLFSEKILAEKGTLLRTLDPQEPEQIINPDSNLARLLRVALFIGVAAALIMLILEIIHLENVMTLETEYGEFVFVPPGTFTMGSPATDTMRYEDETPHTVTLTRPMYIAKTELTQEHWEKVMERNPSAYPGLQFPVDKVTWLEAKTFIEIINQRSKAEWQAQTRQDFYDIENKTERADEAQERLDKLGRSVFGFTREDIDAQYLTAYPSWRLPTESEWEYAARAGSEEVLPADIDGRTWYSSTSELTTHPVAEKTANEWGLYDMNGNVPEWVEDWYRPIYPTSIAVDPVARKDTYWVEKEPEGLETDEPIKVEEVSTTRVLRGGAFYDQLRPVRPANRDSSLPDVGDKYSGFRLVYEPQPLNYEYEELPKIILYFRMKEWYRTNYKQIAHTMSALIADGLEAAGLSSDDAGAITEALEEEAAGESG